MGMARHDVSHELRDREGKWTRGGTALHRMAQEAIDAQSPEAVLAKVRAIEPGGGKNINGHWVDRPASEDHRYRVKLKTSDRGKRDAKVYGSPEEAARAVSAGSHGPGTEAGPGSPPLAPPRREVPPVPPIKGPGDVVRKIAEEEAAKREAERVREETLRKLMAGPPAVHHPRELNVKVQASAEDKKRMRQQVLKATSLQAEITPDLVDRTDITVTTAPHGKRGRTLASHSGQRNTLHIKPDVLIGNNTQAVLEYNRGGWWVPTDHKHDLSMNVMTHEFGHGVHGELNRLGIIQTNRINPTTTSKDEQDFWTGFADAINEEAGGYTNAIKRPEVKHMPEVGNYPARDLMDVEGWLTNNPLAISAYVSRYGSKNMNEMIAELWTEYRLSASPRRPAKYFGDYVTKYLKLHEQLIA